MANDKKVYWLIESNGGLSVTVDDIGKAKEIIEVDFQVESEEGLYDIDDLQYTVRPVLMTEEEFAALPDFNG